MMSSIVCNCKECVHNDHNMRTCTLKVVFIDKDGTCGDKETEGDDDASSADSSPTNSGTSDGDVIDQ